MKQKKSTLELDKILKETEPDEIKDFFKANKSFMVGGKEEFCYYMHDMYKDKNIKLKDVYLIVGVTESYGSKLLRLEKHTINRDLILRFCIAGKFNVDETNRALKLYGMNQLYSRDKRDAAIIVKLNHPYRDIYEIDDYLEENGFDKLSSDK